MKRILLVLILALVGGEVWMQVAKPAEPSAPSVVSGTLQPVAHGTIKNTVHAVTDSIQATTKVTRSARPDSAWVDPTTRKGVYVFQCREAEKVVFSHTPCGKNATEIKVGSANALDSSEWRKRVAEQQKERQEAEQVAAMRHSVSHSSSSEESSWERSTRIRNCMVSAKSEKEKLLCQGVVPVASGGDYSSSTSYSAPPQPPPAPKIITDCDGSGCWDNQGGRYNGGSGGTYFPASGGACFAVGDHMECH